MARVRKREFQALFSHFSTPPRPPLAIQDIGKTAYFQTGASPHGGKGKVARLGHVFFISRYDLIFGNHGGKGDCRFCRRGLFSGCKNAYAGTLLGIPIKQIFPILSVGLPAILCKIFELAG